MLWGSCELKYGEGSGYLRRHWGKGEGGGAGGHLEGHDMHVGAWLIHWHDVADEEAGLAAFKVVLRSW